MRGALQWSVPPKATTDALLRLRKADELEAMRNLGRATDALEKAKQARDAAAAGVTALERRVKSLVSAAGRTTVGTLAQRDVFRAQLRKQLEAAKSKLTIAERALTETLRARERAQRAVEQALRSREAAEAQRDATSAAESRKRERRDQAASDDRWRPPRRG
jgi:hypothetical protein